MTTDKAFKRVVRARMARTGERNAAARRTLVEGATDGQHTEPTADPAAPSSDRMRGGQHPETATLANILANQGVVSGVTGEPLTEAAILGIGGGLGAGYILWEFKRHDGPSPSTTLRSATRRGHGVALPTNGRSLPTRPSRRISAVQPRRSRRSRRFMWR